MIIIYALLGVVLFLNPAENIQTSSDTSVTTTVAVISGKVDLPRNSNSQTRRFRGSAYRNRGGNTGSDSQTDDTNRFENTIISAHPLSFEIENLPTSDSVLINQKDATFFPSVTPVTVGSTVQFVNSDPFFHNVFSLTPGAKFNIGRRPTGDVYSKQVTPPRWKVLGLGPIDLFCDIHSDMNAIILSLDTPYFSRLNEDGSYTLSDLPPGTYEIRVYNRNFELQTRKITVAENVSYDLNFNLAG